MESPSSVVNVVARLASQDIRSSLGSNLDLLRREIGLDPCTASPGQLKAALSATETEPVPFEDAWRVPYLHKLLEKHLLAFYSGDQMEQKEIKKLIDSLIIN